MGSIYQAKNKTSGKCYVGQTQDTKEKDGKPYRYGIAGRWSDHVSSAFRGAKTPLAQAILKHGADDFELTCLEKEVTEERLDEREAHWIAHLKSIVPYGYNVMRHARCKHREQTTLAEHYLPTTTKVRLTIVKANGLPKLVYVYLDQGENEAVRLVFGQSAQSTFEAAREEAQEFAAIFVAKGIDVFEEEVNDPLRKYNEKIDRFRNKTIERIRITKFNHLVALHIKTPDGTTRMCFGGKTVTQTDAYKIAINVKDKLMETHTNVLLEDDMTKSATGGCP